MDNDGILNENDNCPKIANRDQRDSDMDRVGGENFTKISLVFKKEIHRSTLKNLKTEVILKNFSKSHSRCL